MCTQVDYNLALKQSYEFYGAQMVGKVDPAMVPSWRSDALLYEAGPPQLKFGDLTGGFITGSTGTAEAGTVKLTIPIAYSTAMLAWGFLQFPEARAVSSMHVVA